MLQREGQLGIVCVCRRSLLKRASRIVMISRSYIGCEGLPRELEMLLIQMYMYLYLMKGKASAISAAPLAKLASVSTLHRFHASGSARSTCHR